MRSIDKCAHATYHGVKVCIVKGGDVRITHNVADIAVTITRQIRLVLEVPTEDIIDAPRFVLVFDTTFPVRQVVFPRVIQSDAILGIPVIAVVIGFTGKWPVRARPVCECSVAVGGPFIFSLQLILENIEYGISCRVTVYGQREDIEECEHGQSYRVDQTKSAIVHRLKSVSHRQSNSAFVRPLGVNSVPA